MKRPVRHQILWPCCLAGLAVVACSDFLATGEEPVELQPDPWVLAVDPEYTGPADYTIEVEPGLILLHAAIRRTNTCLSVFPEANLKGKSLEITLEYPPKGEDCESSDEWWRLEAGFAVPPRTRYRVLVSDRRTSPPVVLDTTVFVPSD